MHDKRQPTNAGRQRYTSRKRQSPNKAAVHASIKDMCSGIMFWVWNMLDSVYLVTKRRRFWACIGNPKLEQETVEGTQAREMPGYQRRPTTLHDVQGISPPTRALYMHRAKIPHTHHTTPRATIAPGADTLVRHPPQAQQVPAQRTSD